VALFHLPVYTIAGVALLGTLLASIAGVICYQVLALFFTNMQIAPDWPLGILFGLGGFLGMYCGARCQKLIPAKFIKCLLAGCVLFLSGKYILSYFWQG